MKNIKYFFQFIIIIIFFIFFKVLGPNISSAISGKIFEFIGPFFRSKKLIHSNIRKAFSDISFNNLNKTSKMMWNNYGRVFAEYVFIKDFRKGKLESKIDIEGKEILEEIIRCKSQVIFVSGHLSNFELMALYLEKRLESHHLTQNNHRLEQDLIKRYHLCTGYRNQHLC